MPPALPETSWHVKLPKSIRKWIRTEGKKERLRILQKCSFFESHMVLLLSFWQKWHQEAPSCCPEETLATGSGF